MKLGSREIFLQIGVLIYAITFLIRTPIKKKSHSLRIIAINVMVSSLCTYAKGVLQHIFVLQKHTA